MNVAVVLAAGSGRRFTGPDHKLRAELRGRPVLAWAVDHATQSGLTTVVVTGPDDFADLLPPTVTVVANPRHADGQATSLRLGIATAAELGATGVVVGLGDQPSLSAEAWRAVAASTAPIAIATYDGRPGPHPVRLAAEIWPELPTAGDAGAAEIVRERNAEVERIPCTGDPVDIDTVEDLRRWS